MTTALYNRPGKQ